ncbi:hypothetical protein RMN57_36620 [Kitasatospora sp. CM 4170]|uniref:Uncharacterized protein n=1 Tax=Kitasatospora aburaviensis TaxID=67265 RepID=A0ABW1F4N0_9ACTN|nr:hypothetical protein [Kitasatospora sp. CM 4170]WNM49837.1 hypothetical protein RMN57_36620 [Kitasatospora sp. CM 4170]
MTDQRKGSYTVPEEFGELVAEFRGLLEKYPRAAGQFSLAYHPAGDGGGPGTTMTASISQPVFECSEIDTGFVVCRRIDEQ